VLLSALDDDHGKPVDWWFVYKLRTGPAPASIRPAMNTCIVMPIGVRNCTFLSTRCTPGETRWPKRSSNCIPETSTVKKAPHKAA